MAVQVLFKSYTAHTQVHDSTGRVFPGQSPTSNKTYYEWTRKAEASSPSSWGEPQSTGYRTRDRATWQHGCSDSPTIHALSTTLLSFSSRNTLKIADLRTFLKTAPARTDATLKRTQNGEAGQWLQMMMSPVLIYEKKTYVENEFNPGVPTKQAKHPDF